MVSFPRQYAETQGFSLGRPRSFTAGDGRVLFLRSSSGTDPVQKLWVLDDDGERMVVDPALLSAPAELTPEEAARRERVRERAGGITRYAADDALSLVTFALGGALGLAHVDGPALLLPPTGVVDPRPSPDGAMVGYVSGSRLVVADLEGRELWSVAGPEGTTCGLPDFIAGEELHRSRGWWWSPDSDAVLAAVVDDSPVQTWWIADPSDPAKPPVPQRYPSVGTPNAIVTLLLADAQGARPVEWDHEALPYLVDVVWTAQGPALLHLASRDQKRFVVMTIDGTVVREDRSDTWLDIVPGVPRWLPGGRLLHVVEDTAADVRRLAVDGEVVTPSDVHVFAVRGVDPDGDVVFVGNEGDPTSRYVFAWDGTGTERLTEEPGVYDVVCGGDTGCDTQVGLSASMWHFGSAAEVWRGGETVSVWSEAATPPFIPMVKNHTDDRIHVAVVLPSDHVAGTKLPVLLLPYGGPGGHQENLAARAVWLVPQWFANQGFAVVVADGRGTSGVGLAWEKAIENDFTVTLTDQVAALHLAAAREPDLDLTRVGIRGWSFGGKLAALAVLDRPDVFHAAIAGAPVTDQALYDTAYSERYLGVDPTAESYQRSNLIRRAGQLTRPLLLIHGLADDNVFAAHTLLLSAALLAAGKPHDVLPLTGATHLGGGATERENLLLLQVDWLRRHLA